MFKVFLVITSFFSFLISAMEQEPIEQKLYQPLSLQILAAQNVINNIDDYDEKELAAIQDIDEMFKKVPDIKTMPENHVRILQEKLYKHLEAYRKLSDDHEYAYVKNIPDGESFITKKSDPSSQFYHKISGNYSHVEDFCFSPNNKYYAYKTTFLANRPNMVFMGKVAQEEHVAVKPDMLIKDLCFINEETLGILSLDAFYELDITTQHMQKKCVTSHPDLNCTRLYKMGQILIICDPYNSLENSCWHLTKNKQLSLIFDDAIFQEDSTKLSAVNDNLISLINGTSAYVCAVNEQDNALRVKQIAHLPHQHNVTSSAIHPSGKFLVTGTDLNEGMIRLWDIQTQKVVAVSNFGPKSVFAMWSTRGKYYSICDLSWSKDGKYFMAKNGRREAYEFNVGNYLSLVKAIRLVQSKTKKTNSDNNNNNNNHNSNLS